MVSIVLGISAAYFIKDANTLLLYPIDRILTRLKFIANNPQAALNEDIQIESINFLEMLHDDKKKRKN